jgi:hypothetical protein
MNSGMARDWREDLSVGDLVMTEDWAPGSGKIAVVTKRTETPKGPHYDLYFPEIEKMSYSWDCCSNFRRVK